MRKKGENNIRSAGKCGSLNENNDFTFAVESQGKIRAAPKDDSGFPGQSNQCGSVACVTFAWVATGIKLAFTAAPGNSSPRKNLSFAARISGIASYGLL
jgi:hypothetical protein